MSKISYLSNIAFLAFVETGVKLLFSGSDASTRRSSRSLQRRSVDEVRETCQSLYQIFPAV